MKSLFYIAFAQVFKNIKKLFFIVIIISISMIVLLNAMLVNESYYYAEKRISDNINYDLSNVYKINLGTKYLGMHESDIEDIFLLYETINKMENVDCYGGFFLIEDYNKNQLYISDTLLNLCNLVDIDGSKIDYSKIDGKKVAYIGKELLNEYDIGDIFYDEETQKQYIIKGILDSEKSSWISDNIFNGNLINIDKSIIIIVEHENIYENYYLNFNLFSNFFIVINDELKKNEEILYNYRKNVNIDIINFLNLKKMFDIYRKEFFSQKDESEIFPYILCILTVLMIIISFKVQMSFDKREYGILQINGYSHSEVRNIAIIKNFIECFISFIIVQVYWINKIYTNMDIIYLYNSMFFTRMVLWIMLLGFSTLSIIKYFNKKNVLTLLDKGKL